MALPAQFLAHGHCQGRKDLRCVAWRDLVLDLPAQCPVSNIEIVPRLKVDPELRRGPKISGKPKCRVGRDRAATAHDVIGP